MFCRKCGKSLLDGDRFCSYCGAQVIERRESLNINENIEEVVYNRAHFEGLSRDTKPYWNLEGFPVQSDEPRKTEDIRVDWEKRELPKREPLLKFVEEATPQPEEKAEAVEASAPKKVPMPTLSFATMPEAAPENAPEKSEPIDIFEIFDRQLEEEKKKSIEERGTLVFDRQEGKIKLAEEERERQAEEERAKQEKEEKAKKEAEEKARLEAEKEKHTAELEKEIFGAIEKKRERASSSAEEQIDKFYTFSQKNEEFQRLLDKEYERLRGNIPYKAPARTVEEPVVESAPVAAAETVAVSEPKAAEPVEAAFVPEEPVVEETVVEEATVAAEAIVEAKAEPVVSETVIAAAPIGHLEEIVPEEGKERVALEEKSVAAEPIPVAIVAEPPVTVAVEVEEATEPEKVEPAMQSPIGHEEVSAEQVAEVKIPSFVIPAVNHKEEAKEETKEEDNAPVSEDILASIVEDKATDPTKEDLEKVLPWDEEVSVGEFKVEEKKTSPLAVLFGIVAAVLVIEAALVGIKCFLPESPAAKFINEKMGFAVNWVDQIKTEKENPADEEEQEPIQEEVSTLPSADKNALIQANAAYNENIAVIEADDTLAYDENKDYGDEIINNSKPIENNIWYEDENGTTFFYDNEVVKAIIQFDSSWIDYVNGENEATLGILKGGSLAYENAKNYSKVGQVDKKFDFLKIGEIRQNGETFCIWVHEAISTTENGSASTAEYKWVYQLEPVEGQMKIVNYVQF